MKRRKRKDDTCIARLNGKVHAFNSTDGGPHDRIEFEFANGIAGTMLLPSDFVRSLMASQDGPAIRVLVRFDR